MAKSFFYVVTSAKSEKSMTVVGLDNTMMIQVVAKTSLMRILKRELGDGSDDSDNPVLLEI